MPYIDLSKACDYIRNSKLLTDNNKEWAIEEIEKAKVDNVVEVKHGKWLRTKAFPHRIYCSECFGTYVNNENIIAGRSKISGPKYCTEAEYCPHCGAKMDKE